MCVCGGGAIATPAPYSDATVGIHYSKERSYLRSLIIVIELYAATRGPLVACSDISVAADFIRREGAPPYHIIHLVYYIRFVRANNDKTNET